MRYTGTSLFILVWLISFHGEKYLSSFTLRNIDFNLLSISMDHMSQFEFRLVQNKKIKTITTIKFH